MADLTLKGGPELQQRLRQLQRVTTQAAAAGLYAAANNIMTESIQEAPLDMGPLRSSRYVGKPEVKSGSLSVELGYGGAATAYVKVQHEDTSLNHPEPGTKAKFLEDPVSRAVSDFAATVAAFARQAVISGTAPAMPPSTNPETPT